MGGRGGMEKGGGAEEGVGEGRLDRSKGEEVQRSPH